MTEKETIKIPDEVQEALGKRSGGALGPPVEVQGPPAEEFHAKTMEIPRASLEALVMQSTASIIVDHKRGVPVRSFPIISGKVIFSVGMILAFISGVFLQRLPHSVPIPELPPPVKAAAVPVVQLKPEPEPVVEEKRELVVLRLGGSSPAPKKRALWLSPDRPRAWLH